MSREQLLAAMAVLEVSIPDLSDATGLSESTIKRMRSRGGGHVAHWQAAKAWLELEGVVFIEATSAHEATAALRHTG